MAWSRLSEIFGVHKLCLSSSAPAFCSLQLWLSHDQSLPVARQSIVVLWSGFMSTEDKEGISALILSNHLCSDVNCRSRDEGPVHSVTMPSSIMKSCCPRNTSDFVRSHAECFPWMARGIPGEYQGFKKKTSRLERENFDSGPMVLLQLFF